jgi:transposase-like protein
VINTLGGEQRDDTVAEYAEAFRAKMVRKMLPPGAVSANALASETGLSQTTLSRWLKEARTVGVMDKPAKKWTPAEKLRVVVEASQLSDEDLGEFLRREGLHEAQLKEWRALAESAFVDTTRSSKRSPEARRIKELEWEVRRKDKALAEASALLILKKKVEAIWGAMDDDTTGEKDS